METLIRKATIDDVRKLTGLNDKYFHEEGRNWEKLISDNNSEMYVIEKVNDIVGFTGIKIAKWNNTAHIIDIFIHPEERRKGYASKFLNKLLTVAREKGVRTLIAEAPSLNPVLSLYLKSGFRICGYNDRYYSNDGKEAAIFLSYDLK